MLIYSFKCKDCGYETKLPLGSSDLDQILTDTNLDYADYHLFLCKKEAKFVHADIHDKEFDGRCPSDCSELIVADVPPLKCPRCNQANLATEQTNPMDNQYDTQ